VHLYGGEEPQWKVMRALRLILSTMLAKSFWWNLGKRDDIQHLKPQPVARGGERINLPEK
jgi:hypothetical protein